MTQDKTIVADTSLNLFKKKNDHQAACLIQYSGSAIGRRYDIEKDGAIVGRLPQCDIAISEKSISRQHAKFRFIGSSGLVEVEDLGTTNGSFVNDEKIEGSAKLKDGDILRLGTVIFKFFNSDNIDNIFHDKIYRMATIDSGTQIFNKRYLLDALEEEFKKAKLFNKKFSIIYFDLDFFKKVNDSHGHNVGDFILKEVATMVAESLPPEAVFGRFGGEEFVIIMPEIGVQIASGVAEQLREKVEMATFDCGDGLKLKQTLSIGVAEYETSLQEPKALLDIADQKLYEAKKGGRNQTKF